MIEVEFTKDYATYKKGSIAKFNLDLAYQLIAVEKVAKKKEVKEIKSKK
jgi:CobQ-like glutamine amidotransferase family enzyme